MKLFAEILVLFLVMPVWVVKAAVSVQSLGGFLKSLLG
jgi:hypothetical protein